jgi:hypothetical protein
MPAVHWGGRGRTVTRHGRATLTCSCWWPLVCPCTRRTLARVCVWGGGPQGMFLEVRRARPAAAGVEGSPLSAGASMSSPSGSAVTPVRPRMSPMGSSGAGAGSAAGAAGAVQCGAGAVQCGAGPCRAVHGRCSARQRGAVRGIGVGEPALLLTPPSRPFPPPGLLGAGRVARAWLRRAACMCFLC